jgi:hypothetical protein
VARQALDRLAVAARAAHFIAHTAQQVAHDCAKTFIVLNDQDAHVKTFTITNTQRFYKPSIPQKTTFSKPFRASPLTF